MNTLFFLLQGGLFEHQVFRGGLVTLLVNQFIEIPARELVKFLLNERKAVVQLCGRALERGRVLVHFCVDQTMKVLRLFRRNADGLQERNALVDDRCLLGVGLAAFARLAGATVVGVDAAISFRPLRGHHRAAGASKQPTESKVVAVPHFAGLTLDFEDRLHLGKEFRRDEGLEFAFEGFVSPIHDADIQPVREKLPDGKLRPLLAAPARDAKLKEPL